ncbi:MAG: hypothetical protein KGZ59_07705 [Chitinophagaceae bacterium]|nr:hypothetical protein [Chitinophagaceae bacterium]
MMLHFKKSAFSSQYILLSILVLLLFTSSDSYSQRNNSHSFFQLLNSGKKKKQSKQYEIEGTGRLEYKDSLIYGQLLITEADIQMKNENGLLKYAYSDTSLGHIIMKHNGQFLNLVRLKDFDNKLWRLIKDTLGIRIYDKNISYSIDGSNIDYNSLLFQRNSEFIEAVTFWVTSTKRNIVKIINQLLELDLKPIDFKGKEDIMNRIIYNDKTVYSKT